MLTSFQEVIPHLPVSTELALMVSRDVRYVHLSNDLLPFHKALLINIKVVLADGTIVEANADNHADLWRALKGGTSNFGEQIHI